MSHTSHFKGLFDVDQFIFYFEIGPDELVRRVGCYVGIEPVEVADAEWCEYGPRNVDASSSGVVITGMRRGCPHLCLVRS